MTRFKMDFIQYQNCIEGRCSDDEFRCPSCIERIPAPVPFTNNKGELHYRHPETEDLNNHSDCFIPIVQLKPHTVLWITKPTVVDDNQMWKKI